MDMTRWCLMSALGVGLLGAGCTTTETSVQEDLGRGIVRGTLGAQLARTVWLPIPAHTVSFTGHVTAVEGGALRRVIAKLTKHQQTPPQDRKSVV